MTGTKSEQGSVIKGTIDILHVKIGLSLISPKDRILGKINV